jgi:hypothetical protein
VRPIRKDLSIAKHEPQSNYNSGADDDPMDSTTLTPVFDATTTTTNAGAAEGVTSTIGDGSMAATAECDTANEAEYKRANVLMDGLSLYFDEHYKELLSSCGAKSVGIKLVEMRAKANA